MKKMLNIICALLLCSSLSFGQSRFDNWPEMKAYHTMLAQTFHPAEEGDMKPIRTRSYVLLSDCKLIMASPIPMEYNNDQMKKSLKKLEKETDKLNAFVVRQEQSPVVMKQLNIVHDTFHEIMGLCKKNETAKE